MILEKAIVQYNKNGEYDYTIQSDYIEFENEGEINKYIKENIEKDIEYYIYNNEEDVSSGKFKKVIICNEI